MSAQQHISVGRPGKDSARCINDCPDGSIPPKAEGQSIRRQVRVEYWYRARNRFAATGPQTSKRAQNRRAVAFRDVDGKRLDVVDGVVIRVACADRELIRAQPLQFVGRPGEFIGCGVESDSLDSGRVEAERDTLGELAAAAG